MKVAERFAGSAIGFEPVPGPRRRRARWAWTCVALALLALVHLVGPPRRTLAWVTALDVGHAPLFGAIALAMLQFLLASPFASRGRARLYGLAWLAAVALGAGSELLQLGADRNPDPRDVWSDALGAAACLLAASTFDPHTPFSAASRKRARAICRALALLLLLLAFAPAVRVADSYAARAAAFPALCDFAGTWEADFIATHRAGFAYTSSTRQDGAEVPALRLDFEPALYSAFKLIEPYPDWTGYQRLRLVLRSELDHPVDLVLRIHDRAHDDRYADRFNRRLTILPGQNAFAIPLDEIRRAPDAREMDLSAIARLSVFALAPAERFSIELLALGLE